MHFLHKKYVRALPHSKSCIRACSIYVLTVHLLPVGCVFPKIEHCVLHLEAIVLKQIVLGIKKIIILMDTLIWPLSTLTDIQNSKIVRIIIGARRPPKIFYGSKRGCKGSLKDPPPWSPDFFQNFPYFSHFWHLKGGGVIRSFGRNIISFGKKDIGTLWLFFKLEAAYCE